MTNEQINEAIADAIGGKRDTEYGPLYSSSEGWTCNCPNFCRDLNAMHEAEQVIANKCKQNDYWFFLRQIHDFPDAESDWNEMFYFAAINATARERAEAFLRTLGKWEEAQPC